MNRDGIGLFIIVVLAVVVAVALLRLFHAI